MSGQGPPGRPRKEKFGCAPAGVLTLMQTHRKAARRTAARNFPVAKAGRRAAGGGSSDEE
eukprot:1056465-Pelagomonas_calceolata.AAC.1